MKLSKQKNIGITRDVTCLKITVGPTSKQFEHKKLSFASTTLLREAQRRIWKKVVLSPLKSYLVLLHEAQNRGKKLFCL